MILDEIQLLTSCIKVDTQIVIEKQFIVIQNVLEIFLYNNITCFIKKADNILRIV